MWEHHNLNSPHPHSCCTSAIHCVLCLSSCSKQNFRTLMLSCLHICFVLVLKSWMFLACTTSTSKIVCLFVFLQIVFLSLDFCLHAFPLLLIRGSPKSSSTLFTVLFMLSCHTDHLPALPDSAHSISLHIIAHSH